MGSQLGVGVDIHPAAENLKAQRRTPGRQVLARAKGPWDPTTAYKSILGYIIKD